MTPDCRRSIDTNVFRPNMYPPCPLGDPIGVEGLDVVPRPNPVGTETDDSNGTDPLVLRLTVIVPL